MDNLQEIMSYLETRIERAKVAKLSTNNPLLMKFRDGGIMELQDLKIYIENYILKETI